MALADRWQLPYLAEGMRERIEAGLDLHQISRRQHQALCETLLDEMVAGMDTACASAGGFVCDRSPLDLAAFWLYYGFGFDAAATDHYIDRAFAAVADIDHIVLTPLGVFALDDDGVRSTNPWIQTHYAAVLEHFLRRSPVPVLRLQCKPMATRERIDWVIQHIT